MALKTKNKASVKIFAIGGIMIILDVPEMHCNKCVERISGALDQENIKYTVSLEEKTVTIDGCEKCGTIAISTLEDLGFDATIRK